MGATSRGHKRFEKIKKSATRKFGWCLCLQFVNKVKMEQITVFRRNCESAFWKKGMFFDGELRSSVRILHGCENLGFCCCATPIIMTSMPKFAAYRVKVERIVLFGEVANRYFERKYCFSACQFRSSDGCSVRIKGAKTLYLPFVHSKHTASYTGYHLLDLMRWWILENLASEKFVLASE